MKFGFCAGLDWPKLVPRVSRRTRPSRHLRRRENLERDWDWLKWCISTKNTEQGKLCARSNFSCFEGWQEKHAFLALWSHKSPLNSKGNRPYTFIKYFGYSPILIEQKTLDCDHPFQIFLSSSHRV